MSASKSSPTSQPNKLILSKFLATALSYCVGVADIEAVLITMDIVKKQSIE